MKNRKQLLKDVEASLERSLRIYIIVKEMEGDGGMEVGNVQSFIAGYGSAIITHKKITSKEMQEITHRVIDSSFESKKPVKKSKKK